MEAKNICPTCTVTMRLVKSEDLNHHGTLLPDVLLSGLLNQVLSPLHHCLIHKTWFVLKSTECSSLNLQNRVMF